MNCTYTYKGKTFSTDRLYRELAKELPIQSQQESIKFLQNYLGMSEHDILIVKGLIDGRSLGRFKADGRILLSELATVDVAYHEAFHRVWRLFLSTEERSLAVKEVKALKNYKSILEQYKNIYPELTETELIEEFLADEFSDFTINKNFKSPTTLKSLFTRLLNFIKKILGLKPTQIQLIYDKILAKNYANAIPSASQYLKDADKLIIKNVEFSVEQKNDIVQMLTQSFIKAMLEINGDIDLFLNNNSTNIRQMLNEVIIPQVGESIYDQSDDYGEIVDALYADVDAVLQHSRPLEESIFLQGMIRNLRLLGLSITDLEDESDGALTEEEQKIREFKASVEFDPKSRIGKKIKFLLSSLTNTSENNSFGLPKPISWTKAFVQIATRMAGVPTKSFMDKFKTLNLSYIKPLVELLSRDVVFENEFISALAMTENRFYTMRIKDGDLYFDNANSGTKVNKIVNDWKNSLTRKYADFDSWLENLSRLSKTNFTNEQVLDLLGFKVHPSLPNLTTSLRVIMQELSKYKKDKPDSKNVFKTLNIKKYVEELANQQAVFEDSVDLMVYINGKKLYSLGLNTQQTSVINAIKYAQSLFTEDMTQSEKIDLLRQYVPFQVSEFNVTKNEDGTYEVHNLWLQKILNGQKLDLVIPYNVDSQEDDLELSKLDEPDLMAIHLNGALQGFNMAMKHADRSTFFAYTFGEPLYSKSQLGSVSDAFFILTKNIIEQINLEVKFLKNLNVEKFNVQFIGKIKEGAFGKTILGNQFQEVLDGAPINRQLVENFVAREFAAYKKYVSELGLLDSYSVSLYDNDKARKVPALKGINRTILNQYGGNVDLVLAAAFVNEVSSHLFETRFFNGLAETFKSGTDLYKRLAPQSSTGKLSVNSPKVHDYVRTNLNQEFEIVNPVTGEISVLNPALHLTKPEFFRAVTLAERSNFKSFLLQPAVSQTGKPITSKLTGKQESRLFMMFEDGFLKDFPKKSIEDLRKIYEPKFRLYEEKYLTANENDGQSYMTLPAFKNFMIRQGKWSKGMEFVYQIEMAIAKFTSPDDIANLEIEFNGVKIKPFEIKRTEVGEKKFDGWKLRSENGKTVKLDAVHTLKTQFAGYSTPEEYYEQNKSEFSYMFNSVFKTSQHLLLPSAIIGTNLQLMNFSLISNGIDIAHMNSANKVGGVDPKLAATNILKNNDDIRNTNSFIRDIAERGLDFYDKSGYFNHEALTENKEVLTYLADWESLKDQVEIGNKVKDEIKGSTQSLKILLSNLIVNKQERLPGAQQLVDSYLEVVHDMVKSNHDNLLKRIGFNIDTGEFKTLKELEKAILESSQILSAPDNIRNAVKNFFQDPSVGLEVTPMKNKIENVLYSLITNGIISFDRPGTSYPQAAITGYEPLGSRLFEEDGTQLSNQDTLKFYEPVFDDNGDLIKVNPAEVIIPLPDFWIQPLLRWAKTNNLVKAIDKLNKDIELRPELYTFKGLRIPNQQLSSNDVMKVKKFNLPTMQNYILVPTEIVVKVGSDFDIDSVKFYWTEDTASKIFSDISDIELLDMYDNYVETSLAQGLDTLSFEQYKQKYSSKDSLDRKLLDLEKEILLHPRNIHHLLMPVTDEIFVQDTYNDLKTEGLINEPNKDFTGSVLPTTNVKNTVVFVKGKAGVGSVALGITNASTNQIDRLDLNQNYFSETGLGTTKNLFYGLEDNYDLGNYVDSKGTVISENQSQLLSTQVDNVKNPTAVLLGINMQTLGVLGLMLRRRVKPKSVILLLKQPLVEAYLQAQKLNESQITKASGLELSKKKLLKYVLKTHNYNEKELPDVYEQSFSLKDSEMLASAKAGKFDKKQLSYLAYFLELQEQAKEFGRFQATQNSDTKGLKDKQALEQYLANVQQSQAVQIVAAEDQARLNNSGVISPFFKYGRLRYMIYDPFYVLEKTHFGQMLSEFKHYAAESVSFELEDKVRQTIENDFILFLIHNYVTNKAEFNSLMKDHSVAKRVLELKEKLPSNLVLGAFFPMINNTEDLTDNRKIDNLRLFEKELNQLDSNDLRLSLEEIADQDMVLYNDIIKVLFFQTGLNISPFNYSSIIPIGLNSNLRHDFNEYQYVYQDLLKQATSNLTRVSYSEAKSIFEQFKLLFAANNPRFLRNNSEYLWDSKYPFLLAKVRDRETRTVKLRNEMGMFQVQLGDAYHKQYFVSLINGSLVDTPKSEEDIPFTEYEEVKNEVLALGEGVNYTFTPENITSLKPNEIFVFGSNTQGRHGKGAAKLAMNFGAEYGQAEGLQGQTYAVITKDLTKPKAEQAKSVSLEKIGKGLQNMILFAKDNPEKTFLVTKLGSSLAGYSTEEIAGLFKQLEKLIPKNVILPKEYDPRNQSGLSAEGVKTLPMQPDNIAQIKAGTKTITNRTGKFDNGIYKLPDGTLVDVALKGIVKVYGNAISFTDGQMMDKDSFAKAEGFKDWQDFEKNNKFSSKFISGEEPRFVYSIKLAQGSLFDNLEEPTEFNNLEWSLSDSKYTPSLKMYEGFVKLNHLYTGDEILPFIGESEYYRYLVPMLLKMNPEVKTEFTVKPFNTITGRLWQLNAPKKVIDEVFDKADLIREANGVSIGELNYNVIADSSNIETVIHELVHRTLQKEYEQGTEFKKQINELFDYAVANSLNQKLYGYTSPEEFLAEALADPAFMQELNNIPYKEETVWSYLMTLISDFINNLLNVELKSDSVLAEVVRVSEQVLNRNLTELSREKKVTLSSLQQEIVENWDNYFPQYSWMNLAQKQMTAKLVEEGKINLNCSI